MGSQEKFDQNKSAELIPPSKEVLEEARKEAFDKLKIYINDFLTEFKELSVGRGGDLAIRLYMDKFQVDIKKGDDTIHFNSTSFIEVLQEIFPSVYGELRENNNGVEIKKEKTD